VIEGVVLKNWYFLVLEYGIGYFVGLRNLESASELRLGGRRECRQLSRESIFLKQDLLHLILRSSSIAILFSSVMRHRGL